VLGIRETQGWRIPTFSAVIDWLTKSWQHLDLVLTRILVAAPFECFLMGGNVCGLCMFIHDHPRKIPSKILAGCG
jgi:hypothetical protein